MAKGVNYLIAALADYPKFFLLGVKLYPDETAKTIWSVPLEPTAAGISRNGIHDPRALSQG